MGLANDATRLRTASVRQDQRQYCVLVLRTHSVGSVVLPIHTFNSGRRILFRPETCLEMGLTNDAARLRTASVRQDHRQYCVLVLRTHSVGSVVLRLFGNRYTSDERHQAVKQLDGKKEEHSLEFASLAQYFEKLEKTSSRLALIVILAELFRLIESPDEIAKVCYLVQGRVAPPFETLEIGMAEKTVARSIAIAYHTTPEHVLTLYATH